jgi:hypothetical protein
VVVKGKIALVGLLAAILLLSGCIKLQIREDIGLLGTSDIKMTLEPVNVSAMGWDKKNPCNEFNASSAGKLFTGAKCSFDGKKETILGKFDRKKAGGLTITGTKYRFDLIKALDAFNENKSKQSQIKLQEHKNTTQINQAKDAGMAYDYVVKLPGTVTSQNGGTIQPDGSVKFDLLELEAGDNPYVESNTGLGGMIGGIGKMTQEKPSAEGKAPEKAKSENSKICCIPLVTLIIAGLGATSARVVL